jgi:hypothetical protein
MKLDRFASQRFHKITTFFSNEHPEPDPIAAEWQDVRECTMRVNCVEDPVAKRPIHHDYRVILDIKDFCSLAKEYATRIDISPELFSTEMRDCSIALKQLAACAEGYSLRPLIAEQHLMQKTG